MFVFNQRSLRAFNEKTLVHYKKHATIMAVLMLICGICCLIYPIAAGVYLSYATGFMFLVCGFYSIYSLFSSGKKQLKAKFTYAFFAIAWLLLGYCFLVNPVIGMNSLAMVFCCLFILGGIFRIASGVKLFRSPGYGWNIFIGIFDLLIAGVWLNMDPDRSYVFTSIFIGVEMIFSSFAFISLRRNATLVKTDKLADKN
ncbi:DUF308 domain-containing protein [Citrobacter portucalensis]|uniref:DUF308 domain-containing protein n=1 Tax=Citrobacter portucalensis TaxID=1639133 RepID=A0AAW5WAE1_9ENTR|nr:DUF308 domain-containing protein [Citrobacter portucalensis]MCX9002435.1 DUF308 domain-containing protein [Citrobacter portucalensis]